jgi:hypothetical protein
LVYSPEGDGLFLFDELASWAAALRCWFLFFGWEGKDDGVKLVHGGVRVAHGQNLPSPLKPARHFAINRSIAYTRRERIPQNRRRLAVRDLEMLILVE